MSAWHGLGGFGFGKGHITTTPNQLNFSNFQLCCHCSQAQTISSHAIHDEVNHTMTTTTITKKNDGADQVNSTA